MSDDDKQVQRLRLSADITAAIGRSKLPWPENGHVIAEALTNWLGNPGALRVHADGCINYFDGKQVTGRPDNPQAMAREFLDAMPGETYATKCEAAMGLLKDVAGWLDTPVVLGPALRTGKRDD